MPKSSLRATLAAIAIGAGVFGREQCSSGHVGLEFNSKSKHVSGKQRNRPVRPRQYSDYPRRIYEQHIYHANRPIRKKRARAKSGSA